MTDSKFDLNAIRLRLLERRSALVDRHVRVDRDLARGNEPLVADSSDQAIQTANDEVLERIDDAARHDIAAIDGALERLDRGQYGVCLECEREIEIARLRALPHATTCVHCAELGAAHGTSNAAPVS